MWILSVILIWLFVTAGSFGLILNRRKTVKKLEQYIEIMNKDHRPLCFITDGIKHSTDDSDADLIAPSKTTIGLSKCVSYTVASLIASIMKSSTMLSDLGCEIYVCEGCSYFGLKNEHKERLINSEKRHFVVVYCKRDIYKLAPIIIDPIGKNPTVTLENIEECAEDQKGLTIVIRDLFDQNFTMYRIYTDEGEFSIGQKSHKVDVVRGAIKAGMPQDRMIKIADAAVYDIITRRML